MEPRPAELAVGHGPHADRFELGDRVGDRDVLGRTELGGRDRPLGALLAGGEQCGRAHRLPTWSARNGGSIVLMDGMMTARPPPAPTHVRAWRTARRMRTEPIVIEQADEEHQPGNHHTSGDQATVGAALVEVLPADERGHQHARLPQGGDVADRGAPHGDHHQSVGGETHRAGEEVHPPTPRQRPPQRRALSCRHAVDAHHHGTRNEHREHVRVATDVAGGVAVDGGVDADHRRHHERREHLCQLGTDRQQHHPDGDGGDRDHTEHAELVVEQHDAADTGEQRSSAARDAGRRARSPPGRTRWRGRRCRGRAPCP